MQVTYYDRLQKMRDMALRSRGALGDDFSVVIDILDKRIKANNIPSHSQRRLRGKIDLLCYGA